MDSGATNNFISKALATSLKLQIGVAKPVPIFMGHGHPTESIGGCLGVTLLIQDLEIVADFLLLYMNQFESDLILRYSWLTKLGEAWINWKENTMSFYHKTSWVKLSNQGDDSKRSKRDYKMLFRRS